MSGKQLARSGRASVPRRDPIPPPVGADPSLAPLDVLQILRVLRRRIWLILGITMLAAPVAGYVWLTTVPTYRAEAVIRLADVPSALTGGLVTSPTPALSGRTADPLLSEIEVMGSRRTAGEVVDSTPRLRVRSRGVPTRLIDGVRFLPGTPPDSVPLDFHETEFAVRQGTGRTVPYGTPVTVSGLVFTVVARPKAAPGTAGPLAELEALGESLFPVVERPDGRQGSLYVLDRDEAIERLVADLEVIPRKNTDLVEISHVDADPDVATVTVNRLIEVYQQIDARAARRQAWLQGEFLSERLGGLDGTLRNARGRLATFRAEQGTAYRRAGGAEGQGDVLMERQDISSRQRRYEALLEQLRSGDRSEQRAAVRTALSEPALSGNIAVAQLFEQVLQYEEQRDSALGVRPATHPSVRRLEELGNAAEERMVQATESALLSVAGSLEARISALDVVRHQAEADYRKFATAAAEEARLEEEVTTTSRLAEQLRQELQQARLAEAVEVGRVQVLEPAIGAELVGVGPARKAGFVLGAGLLLGILVAFVTDRVGTSMGGPSERLAFGLPVLGVVPRLKAARGATWKTSAPVIEALRGVRLNVRHAHGTAGTLITTVTSPSRGEGKSFIATNLALAFAHAGFKTLLIDGDVRRGVLHELMDRPRKPGLTDFLGGQVARNQMIQKTEVPGLDLIASGTRTPQGPELLGSPAVSQLFMALRSNYGVILVDSPPLGAGVDALSLGTVAGTMVLVLRSGGAQSDATEARLDVAERLPIRLLGAVVNGAREGPDGAYPGYYIEDYEFAGVEDPGTPVIHGETAASRLGSGWVSRRG